MHPQGQSVLVGGNGCERAVRVVDVVQLDIYQVVLSPCYQPLVTKLLMN